MTIKEVCARGKRRVQDADKIEGVYKDSSMGRTGPKFGFLIAQSANESI